MKLYFIRHIPTGHYLPEPKGRNGRGGSHLEPSPDKDDARIFRSLLSAKRFLGTWLKGKYVCNRGYSDGHPDNDWERDYYEEISVIPVTSRIREDMEIIEKDIIL